VASDLQAANTALKAYIDGAWSATDIAWEDVVFEPSDQESWLRVSIQWGDGFGRTMGTAGANSVVGVLSLDLFYRPGAGAGGVTAQADALRDLVNRRTIGPCRLGVPTGPLPGPLDDEGWAMRTVTVPFTVEETI